MKKKEEMFYFLNGWSEVSGADEMSDGAWQAVIMEGVEAFNEEEGTDFDPHEGWLAWVSWEDNPQG